MSEAILSRCAADSSSTYASARRRVSCGRSGDVFLVRAYRRSRPWISVIRSWRARACRRVLRVSRSAYLVSSPGSTGLAVSTRSFASRGGGALLNATPRFRLISKPGPPGQVVSALEASAPTHSTLMSPAWIEAVPELMVGDDDDDDLAAGGGDEAMLGAGFSSFLASGADQAEPVIRSRPANVASFENALVRLIPSYLPQADSTTCR